MKKLGMTVTTEARGFSNVFVVRLVGTKGKATLYRRTEAEVGATARKYAMLLGVPLTT